jgi:hypothetical protein
MNKRILEENKETILNYITTTSDNISSEDFYLLVGMDIDVPDQVIENNKELYNSARVLYYYLKKDPLKHKLFSDVAFSKDNIEYIINVGVKYQNINPSYDAFLLRVFSIDKNALRVFPEYLITNNVVRDAVKRGFILTKDDLFNNPSLAYSKPLMNYFVYHYPELIKYKKCELIKSVVNASLAHVILTEEDLFNNPSLCSDEEVMNRCKGLRLFASNLSEQEKIIIVSELIKSKKYDEVFKLPFFNSTFNKYTDKDKLKEIFNNIFIEFDDHDMDTEEVFFDEMNKISESIIFKCYMDTKGTFKYNNLIEIYNGVKSGFQSDYEYKKFRIDIENFINLGNFGEVNKKTNDLLEELDIYYNEYRNLVSLDEIKDLLISILNEHRNSYLKYLKYNINLSIQSKLNLTDKKYKLILNSLKLEKITEYIRDKNFYLFNTTKVEIDNVLNNLKNDLYNNKKLKKSKIVTSEILFDLLEEEFYNYGLIRKEYLINNLNITDKEVIKIIINKFEQVKINFTDRITLNSLEYMNRIKYAKETLGFNINNFKIVDKDQYINNISTLLVKLNITDIEEILENKNYDVFKNLLLYLNILEDFDLNNFKSILINSDKIYKYVGLSNGEVNFLKFSSILNYAKTFNYINDVKRLILTDKVVSNIDNLYLDDYFETYLRMLEKTRCAVPPIKYELSDVLIESGKYSECERLNIGVYYQDSCLDLLNSAGKDGYLESLTSISGDVIIVRDKNTLEFKKRFIAIRRGNVLLVIPRLLDENSLVFLEYMGKKMMDEIKKAEDNIDYIFTPKICCIDEYKTGKVVTDNRFVNLFSHADVSNSVYLIGYKDGKKPLNFFEEYDLCYEKVRKEINYNPSNNEVNRIKALYYYLNNDLKSLTPYIKEDYIFSAVGEDWCYLINKNNEVEEYILPYDKDKAKREIDNMLEISLNRN